MSGQMKAAAFSVDESIRTDPSCPIVPANCSGLCETQYYVVSTSKAAERVVGHQRVSAPGWTGSARPKKKSDGGVFAM